MKRIFLFLFFLSTVFAAIPDGYYDPAAGLSGTELKAALHNIIDDHTESSYSFLWTALRYTDEDPDNSSNFILIYTGRSLSKTQVYPDWNREHSWPKSHGDFGNTPPAGTDMHHLRPCDESVNSDRGNKDFDDGGTAHSEAIGCYSDADSWEPRDEVKGDVARMMFYMEVRYEGDSGEPDLELVDYTGTSGSTLGKLSTLLAWHTQDPVSDFESRRNDRVYSYQNNRNPFIDHPEYVSYIWEGAVPDAVVDIPEKFYIGKVYPNPFNPNCILPLELSDETSVNIELFDILGNIKKTIINRSLSAGHHLIPIGGSDLSTGIYFIRALVGTDIAVRKVVMVK